MLKETRIKLIALFLIGLHINNYSQSSYTLTPSQKNEDCTKGAAGIDVQGLQTTDTLTIDWSNGQSAVSSINDLSEGDYNAHVIIKNKLDTTVNYKIEKEKCKVVASNHFTPNGDNYNDVWQLANTQYYPNFELYVFNKWGQQVHSQKGSYTPWDGKWNGINALDGTYYYVFYYDGNNKHDLAKGDVTILR
jgi:gliding motility-associated-like protein